jgi:hypothetical protein
MRIDGPYKWFENSLVAIKHQLLSDFLTQYEEIGYPGSQLKWYRINLLSGN